MQGCTLEVTLKLKGISVRKDSLTAEFIINKYLRSRAFFFVQDCIPLPANDHLITSLLTKSFAVFFSRFKETKPWAS